MGPNLANALKCIIKAFFLFGSIGTLMVATFLRIGDLKLADGVLV